MNATVRKRLYPVVYMFAATLVCVSSVSAVHLATRQRIGRNQRLYSQRAVLAAAGIEVPQDAVDAVRLFDARARPRPPGSAPTLYEIRDAGGALQGYVFPRVGVGLWGRIAAQVGMSADLSAFTGVRFTKHDETPGLGARIDEPWFGRQFAGKSGPFRTVPEGTRTSDPGEFDAITGATITTRGVRDMLNGTLKEAPGLVAAQAEASPP